jgi:hypothetical protein
MILNARKDRVFRENLDSCAIRGFVTRTVSHTTVQKILTIAFIGLMWVAPLAVSANKTNTTRQTSHAKPKVNASEFPIERVNISVCAPSGLEGAAGINTWMGRVELAARLSLVAEATSPSHTHVFKGPFIINQVSNAYPRVLALQAQRSAACMDGPILDHSGPEHTATYPLILGIGGNLTGSLTLRGTNTYHHGTIITNFGNAINGVIVARGSNLGTGPVSVGGAGTRLRIDGPRGIRAPLSLTSGATVTLTSQGATTSHCTPIAVADGAELHLQANDCLNASVTLKLDASGVVHVESNIVQHVTYLVIGAQSMDKGIYTQAELPLNIHGNGALQVRGSPPVGFIFILR